MLVVYPACIFKEQGAISVVFPDFNYLATQGKSEKEATEKAIECLTGRLHQMEKDKEIFPKPSSIAKISLKDIAKELNADRKGAKIKQIIIAI